MYKKTIYLSYIFSIFFLVFFITFLYIYKTKTPTNSSIKLKQQFVALSSMPNLAFGTDTYYIRTGSLSSVFDIYSYAPLLREFTPLSFTYNTRIKEIKR